MDYRGTREIISHSQGSGDVSRTSPFFVLGCNVNPESCKPQHAVEEIQFSGHAMRHVNRLIIRTKK
jgi:organic radical activating enzyme